MKPLGENGSIFRVVSMNGFGQCRYGFKIVWRHAAPDGICTKSGHTGFPLRLKVARDMP
jgi:hypothetical protein